MSDDQPSASATETRAPRKRASRKKAVADTGVEPANGAQAQSGDTGDTTGEATAPQKPRTRRTRAKVSADGTDPSAEAAPAKKRAPRKTAAKKSADTAEKPKRTRASKQAGNETAVTRSRQKAAAVPPDTEPGIELTTAVPKPKAPRRRTKTATTEATAPGTTAQTQAATDLFTDDTARTSVELPTPAPAATTVARHDEPTVPGEPTAPPPLAAVVEAVAPAVADDSEKTAHTPSPEPLSVEPPAIVTGMAALASTSAEHPPAPVAATEATQTVEPVEVAHVVEAPEAPEVPDAPKTSRPAKPNDASDSNATATPVPIASPSPATGAPAAIANARPEPQRRRSRKSRRPTTQRATESRQDMPAASPAAPARAPARSKPVKIPSRGPDRRTQLLALVARVRKHSLPYLRLCRLDRPIGYLLLLWPTWWALWAAAEGMPPWNMLVIFTLGVIVMRSAGCVINDYADRWLDPLVKRTQARPLATGEVTGQQALMLFLGLLLVALLLASRTNPLTIKLAVIGAFLAASYPYLKRYTHLPQLYLGVAFGWAIPMAFAAITGEVPKLAWLLFLANVLWATAYDTFYAMVDRDDDLRVGAKSTAILFADMDLVAIGMLQGTFLLAMVFVGQQLQLGMVYWLAILIGAGLVAAQLWRARARDRDGCFAAFIDNHWLGMVLFLGLAIGLYQRGAVA